MATYPSTTDPAIVSSALYPVRENPGPIVTRSRKFDFSSIASPVIGDVIRLIDIHKGEKVMSVVLHIITASTTTNADISLGDGAAAAGFLAATSIDSGSGTAVSGAGASIGKIYTAEDSIDITTAVAAPLNGIVEVIVEVMQLWAE